MPVFRRDEFAAAFGRQAGDRAVTELLKYHLRAGNVRRIARGLFARIPKGGPPAADSADKFLAASRLRLGAIIAYRSALELHGYCQEAAAMSEVQLIAPGEPGVIATADFACRLVSLPNGHSLGDGVTTIERQGLAVRLTTLEQTLVDLFDRYSLAGGAEDLFRSLEVVAERAESLDIEAMVDFARQLNNSTASGALGYWLDHERDRLGVTTASLEELRSLAPRHARYALGARPGRGRAGTGWNVILPAAIVERYFDD